MHIEVYSDGSATVATKPGGYGFVVVIDGTKRTEGSGQMLTATNNDAELEGAIQGLASVLKMIVDDPAAFPLGYEVTLVSDSQIVLGWADGTYRFKQKNKRNKFDQLMYLVKKLRVKTRWVEGHSGDDNNERCDKLANDARKLLVREEPKEKKPKLGKQIPKIGNKKDGCFNIWYNGVLKIIDLDSNVCENHDEKVHGPRTSVLAIHSKVKP